MAADDRQCRECKPGWMRVITSRRVGNSQQQRRECTSCGARITVFVPADRVCPKKAFVLRRTGILPPGPPAGESFNARREGRHEGD
jgi:hypothetical protein